MTSSLKVTFAGLLLNAFLGIGMFFLFGFMSGRLEIALIASVGFWTYGTIEWHRVSGIVPERRQEE